jgi:hypothetical protein
MKFKEAKKIYGQITRSMWKTRPTCQELINQKDTWTLPIEELPLPIDEELKHILDSEEVVKKRIVYALLKNKLHFGPFSPCTLS